MTSFGTFGTVIPTISFTTSSSFFFLTSTPTMSLSEPQDSPTTYPTVDDCPTRVAPPASVDAPPVFPALNSIPQYACPYPNEGPLTIPPDNTFMRLKRSSPNFLCSLIRISSNSNNEQTIVPVARSYNGNGWEKVAGAFTNIIIEKNAGERDYLIRVPTLSNNAFYLIIGSEREISATEEVARFLEQTTFGVTRSMIKEWNNKLSDLPNAFGQWVQDQMSLSTTPLSSHRKYYRKRASERIFLSMAEGQPFHPCAQYSRWSRYSLFKSEVKKVLAVEGVHPGPYLIIMDGKPRTMVDNFDVKDLGTVKIPGDYLLCDVEEYVGGKVVINVEGACRDLLGGNPPVDFYMGIVPGTMFSFPTWRKANFEVITSYKKDSLIHLGDIRDSTCDNASVDDAYPSFIQFGDGDWLLYDPRIVLKENTPEMPLPQGGGKERLMMGSLCANVPRTFMNERECVLSNDAGTCAAWREGAESVGGAGTMVCGSINEVANDPTVRIGFKFDVEFSARHALQTTKYSTWFMIALYEKDQLRQRMAWALSQILAVSPGAVGRAWASEIFSHYYDIFVRHAFGNYLDVLKEVSYSPIMGQMLTYHMSRSTEFIERTYGLMSYPDENYAREIMQLFSIGTVELNMDGTPVLDEQGNEVPTYDNKDIMSFARAWTGFINQNERGNIELIEDYNRIDPMNLKIKWRDWFPKMNLYDGYIGDGYPLCRDLPDQAFLRKGAAYRLIGSEEHAEQQKDKWDVYDYKMYVTLENGGTSSLFNTLCQPRSPGGTDCQYPSYVDITQNLPCTGIECRIQTFRVVRVKDFYYEYLRIPCVELAFFNAVKVATPKQQYAMCADPKLPIAMVACCDPRLLSVAYRDMNCEYVSERVNYDMASARCAAVGKQTCHYNAVRDRKESACHILGYYWEMIWNDAEAGCDIYVKIDSEGSVSLVHKPEGQSDEEVPLQFQLSSPVYFRVNWKDGKFPNSLSNKCANGVCEDIGDQCLCNTAVIESAVWTEVCAIPFSANEILSRLFIGSVSPDTYDDADYDPPIEHGEAKVYIRTGGTCGVDTIIEVPFHGKPKYFKNIESIVHIAHATDGSTRNYSFRSAPHFINLLDYYQRDAYTETDAVLEHYFHHKNTAPFLAIRFIQRFGISNPSPRFVKTVAEAFVTGKYKYKNNFEYGSGDYGDLGATVAAIVLDRESRSVVLDADPSYGSMKEPIVKLVEFMRAMEFEPFPEWPEVALEVVNDKVGQCPHELPGVFSFFLPEYSPPGPIGDAMLVSPETQIHVTPNVIGLLNGFISMVKWGLSRCYGGLGPSTDGTCLIPEGNFSKAAGSVTFVPTSWDGKELVDELATLLTAGRLNGKSRKIIEDAYNNAPDKTTGLRLAQQLVATTAEFHTNSLIEMLDIPEPNEAPAQSPPSNSYKAVIMLLLDGACDSYNMIVPHSGCKVNGAPKDMYEEYNKARGAVALSKQALLTIDSSASPQVCSTFGLHPDLPFLKTLYDEKDLLFVANAGVLTEPANRFTYKEKTKTQLFAHNVQTKYAQQLDPFQVVPGTGVLGRMTDALTRRGYKAGLTSVNGEAYALVGEAGVSPSVNFVNGIGILPFNLNPTSENMGSLIRNLNKETTLMSSFFGKTWNKILKTSLISNEQVNNAMEKSDVSEFFPDSRLGNSMSLIARMIKAHGDLGTNRDVFYVKFPGFDSHADEWETISEKFTEINDAFISFVNEMKLQGRWNDIVMLEVSEFGRTLSPNGGVGTDHGWGGNYFLMGGSVKGGNILGQYPVDLSDSGLLNAGRGRVIPSTSWEQIWNGIAQWFDITESTDLDRVLPNRKKFPNLFTSRDLFMS